MANSYLDELMVPRPPYRMARPTVRLVAEESPTDDESARKSYGEHLKRNAAEFSGATKPLNTLEEEYESAEAALRRAEQSGDTRRIESLKVLTQQYSDALEKNYVPPPAPPALPTTGYEVELGRMKAKQAELRAAGKETEAAAYDKGIASYEKWKQEQDAKMGVPTVSPEIPSDDDAAVQRAAGEGMTGSPPPAPENPNERQAQEERARKADSAYKSSVTKAQSAAIKENEAHEERIREAELKRAVESAPPAKKMLVQTALDAMNRYRMLEQAGGSQEQVKTAKEQYERAYSEWKSVGVFAPNAMQVARLVAEDVPANEELARQNEARLRMEEDAALKRINERTGPQNPEQLATPEAIDASVHDAAQKAIDKAPPAKPEIIQAENEYLGKVQGSQRVNMPPTAEIQAVREAAQKHLEANMGLDAVGKPAGGLSRGRIGFETDDVKPEVHGSAPSVPSKIGFQTSDMTPEAPKSATTGPTTPVSGAPISSEGLQPPTPENPAERQAQEDRARRESITFKSAVTKSQSEALKENKAFDERKEAFDAHNKEAELKKGIEFAQPAEKTLGQKALDAMNRYRMFEQVDAPEAQVQKAKDEYRQANAQWEAARDAERAKRATAQEAPTQKKEVGSERVSMAPTPDIERARATVAEGGGDGGVPPEQPRVKTESGGEGEPPPAGQAEKAVYQEIQKIRQMGDSRPISFWARVGAFQEQSIHDVAAWWNGIGERIAKEKLEKQHEKVRNLEEAAKAYSEGSIMGQILSPLRYRFRILSARRRRDELEAHQNMFADRKARHEGARNEALSAIAQQLDIRLKSLERQAHRYENEIDQLDEYLGMVDSELLVVGQKFTMEQNPKLKSDMKDEIGYLQKEFEKTRIQVDALRAKLAKINEDAVQAGYLQNRYSRRAHPSDIPVSSQAPREIVLGTRQNREKKHFTKRAA